MKKVQLLKVSMLAATVFMAACSTVSAEKPAMMEPTAAGYEKALAAATAAVKKAASVGGEWRDTAWKKSTFVSYKTADGKTVKGSYMDIAAVAAKEGNYEKAVSLLETARFQGEMGYKQAMQQKNAGPHF
ncbi:MAG: hypothetical protein PVG66_04495 [Chromatiales bacterium]|jgi:hypothetical protein